MPSLHKMQTGTSNTERTFLALFFPKKHIGHSQ